MNKFFSNSLIITLAVTTVLFTAACDKYLNVVPDDGLATVEMSFNLRSSAIRYLGTCYAYMPNDGVPASDYGMLTGDEL